VRTVGKEHAGPRDLSEAVEESALAVGDAFDLDV
jgi:hypothetical protein